MVWSLALAICSTAVVHPWFLKSALKKAKDHSRRLLINDDDSSAYHRGFKAFTHFNVGCAIFTFVIAMLVQLLAQTRLTAYGFIVPIIIALGIQILGTWRFWNGLSTKKKAITSVLFGVAILFCISLPINNAIYSYSEKANEQSQREVQRINFAENNEGKIFKPLPSADMAKLCKSYSANGPQPLGTQYVYTLSGGQTGDAVAVLDEVGITIYPSKYNGTDISFHLRNKYLYDEIVCIQIEIIEGTPFGKFALISRPLYGPPTLMSYVYLNMVTGETISK